MVTLLILQCGRRAKERASQLPVPQKLPEEGDHLAARHESAAELRGGCDQQHEQHRRQRQCQRRERQQRQLKVNSPPFPPCDHGYLASILRLP